jgi:signal transduction histidine kinase
MLRRKLLMILSSVILLLMVLAVAALISLQSIFSKLDHINTQANAVVELTNHMNLTISRVEILLHDLYTRKIHRLDELIESVEFMQAMDQQLGDYYIVHQPQIGDFYNQLRPLLEKFKAQISTLATTEDRQLLERHNIVALEAASALRNHILIVSQYAHQHSQNETTELTSHFRYFVIAIAAGFLLVINISILVLLRSANMILKPMEKLLVASRELAMEHFDYRVSIEQKDEFGELADAYNHLAQQLQHKEQQRMETLQQVALTLNHELNNAVSVIDLQLRLMTRQTDDKPAFESSLKQIHENLDRMTRVVQGLKNARRIVLTDYVDGVKMLDLERSASESVDLLQSEMQLTEPDKKSDAIDDKPCACGKGACSPKPDAQPKTHAEVKPVVTTSATVSEHDSHDDLDMSDDPVRDHMLLVRLKWFVRLRWLAALGVIAGAIADWQWMHWFSANVQIGLVGVAILLYNGIFRQWVGHEKFTPKRGQILAWAQIILDLGVLSLLTVWTGGVTSPLLGFFVFHMVFASLLLPRQTAYAGALLSVVMVILGLLISGQWPTQQIHPVQTHLVIAGWGLTLLLTVYLANSITQSLHHHRYRLMTQNHRVQSMAHQLRAQQQTMLQHEKMVAMGQMAAGVAHEIANPLANIDSMLQLALRNPDRITPQKLEQMRLQATRIREILSQLTRFAHPTDMQWETMPIIDLVELGLSMVRFDRRHRTVKIERHYSKTPCVLHIQPHAMQQVLINLMINAIDAVSEVAEPKLIVSTQCFGDECHISVTDNGMGITQENIDHLFEPFFTTKPVGKGTGLGLAISYSLVTRQGGRIDVESTVGRGTTMTIALPKPKGQPQTCELPGDEAGPQTQS